MGRSLGIVVKLLVVAMIVGMWAAAARPASAQTSKSACEAEKHALINACKPVVYGALPSPQCCQRVRVTDAECICPLITPQLAALIDVNRAIRLVEGCGRRVPHHFKCGSITTP